MGARRRSLHTDGFSNLCLLQFSSTLDQHDCSPPPSSSTGEASFASGTPECAAGRATATAVATGGEMAGATLVRGEPPPPPPPPSPPSPPPPPSPPSPLPPLPPGAPRSAAALQMSRKMASSVGCHSK
eukprot:scaffold30178_cov76-Phaeocystis_antarctica.AAC.2